MEVLALLLWLHSSINIQQETFEFTAYTHTGYRCATMVYPQEGLTIAVDPSVIPLNSWVWVEGKGLRKAMDTGGDIKKKRIDLFLGTEQECRVFGRRDLNVWRVKI
jgi:3D (Asp-Asp-Asp) domain-containing protein